MPSIIDQLTIELGWDLRKFFEQSKEFERHINQRRDEFEKTTKIWEVALTNLGTTLLKTASAFLTIGAAIRGLESTQHISRAGTEFANLAQSIGISAEKLSQWEQAIERLGGHKEEVRAAFQTTQAQFQQTYLGLQGAPFGPEGAGYLQLLGIDWKNYKNSNGVADVDRFWKDVFAAAERKKLSAPQRTEIFNRLGFPGTAVQALSKGQTLEDLLSQTKTTAWTDANVEAFRRLNEAWTKLMQTADSLGRDFVMYLEKPIRQVLDALQALVDWWKGVIPTLPHLDFARPVAPGWNPFTSESTPAPAPATPAPAAPAAPSGGGTWYNPSGRPLESGWDWLFGGSSSSSGGTSSAPAPGPAPGSGVMDPATGNVYMKPPASTFEQMGPARFRRVSALDSLTTLPQFARAGASTPTGGSTTTTNSTALTIGGMTFQSRTNDAMMGHAPSGLDKDLSVAAYAVNFNEALE